MFRPFHSIRRSVLPDSCQLFAYENDLVPPLHNIETNCSQYKFLDGFIPELFIWQQKVLKFHVNVAICSELGRTGTNLNLSSAESPRNRIG